MKKISVRLFLITILAITSLGLASCGSNETDDTQGASSGEKLPFVGATIYKYDDNFMSFIRRGMETAAEGKVELEIVDSQNNQAMQGDQVDTFLAKGVQALAINLVDPKAAPSIIEKASAKDIPVVFFNKEPEASAMQSYDKTWFVGTDSKESGIIQGQVIVEAWQNNQDAWDKNGDGIIQYVLLKGEPGHPDAEARTRYSISTIEEAGIEVEELAIDTGMWDASKAKEKMDAWLSSQGDNIELVIANNDGMALGAIAALEGAGFTEDKIIPVVGVDAIPDALEMIKNGKMFGTVLNDAKNQSKMIIQASENVALGKEITDGTEYQLDENKAIRVPYIGITMDNLSVAEESYK